MWTHVHLECHIVWDDVLWSCIATYQEDDQHAPVTLEKRGRVGGVGDGGPDAALALAVRALQSKAFEGRA